MKVLSLVSSVRRQCAEGYVRVKQWDYFDAPSGCLFPNSLKSVRCISSKIVLSLSIWSLYQGSRSPSLIADIPDGNVSFLLVEGGVFSS